MNMDVGKVSLEYLDRPIGLTYEFVRRLAAKASCIGDGNAFGFYLREEMEQEGQAFLAQMAATPGQAGEVTGWIECLPWDESGYLILAFNW